MFHYSFNFINKISVVLCGLIFLNTSHAIIGGKLTHDFPAVGVVTDEANNEQSCKPKVNGPCNATLISPNAILTSSYYLCANTEVFIACKHNSEDDSEDDTFTIITRKITQKYLGNTKIPDQQYAIFILDKPIPPTEIEPIQLYAEKVIPGDKFKILGYGASDYTVFWEGKNYTPVYGFNRIVVDFDTNYGFKRIGVNYATNPMNDNSDYHGWDKNFYLVDPSDGASKGGAVPGHQDFGAPALIETDGTHFLAGTANHGYTFENQSDLAAFTSVFSNLKVIQDIVEDHGGACSSTIRVRKLKVGECTTRVSKRQKKRINLVRRLEDDNSFEQYQARCANNADQLVETSVRIGTRGRTIKRELAKQCLE